VPDHLLVPPDFMMPKISDPDKWSSEMRSFIDLALQIDQKKRASADDLLADSFISKAADRKRMKTILDYIFMEKSIGI